jgi:hypothetical protein
MPGSPRYGIWFNGDATWTGPNTVHGMGQGYELNKTAAGSADCIPILMTGSPSRWAAITMEHQRAEGCGNTLVKATGHIRRARVSFIDAADEYTYPESQFLDASGITASGDIRVFRENHGNDPVMFPHTVIDSGKVIDNCLQITGSIIVVKNMTQVSNVGAAPLTQGITQYGNFGPSFDANGRMLNPGPYYGFAIDLNGEHSLVVEGDRDNADAVNFFVLAYAAGVQIYAANKVWLANGTAPSNNNNAYGGFYDCGVQPSVNGATRFVETFTFDNAIDRVFMAARFRTKQWSIRSMGKGPQLYLLEPQFRDKLFADNTPIALTNRTYRQGETVAKRSTASGTTSGWAFDATPTPKPLANIP